MKAMLIIDMPNSCFECPCKEDEMDYCHATTDRKGCPWNYIPEWCPLKPMPEKKNDQWIISENKEDEYHVGWNDCIDEILGEEKRFYETVFQE